MGLESQYQNTTSNFQITVEMATRKLGENESVDSFFHDMLALRAKLKPPMEQCDEIKIINANLR